MDVSPRPALREYIDPVLRESARATRRIGDLFGIAVAPAMSPDDKVRAALDLARADMEADVAYVGRILDGVLELTHVSGAAPGVERGSTEPVSAALVRRVLEEQDVVAMTDVASSRWRSFIGIPLIIDGVIDGAIGLLFEAAAVPFPAADRAYARSVGALVSTVVQQGQREQRLASLAFHDTLTGLPNRALLNDRIERALLTARRNRRSFAVHYVDIDHFKEVNDQFGHHVGDGVLVAVAAWLQSHVRDSDTVARIGGDEFVVLQPEIDAAHHAEDVAARLVTIRDAALPVGDRLVPVRLSVGVAVYPADGTNPVDMLRAADAMLYEVKGRGRDGYALRTVSP
jgi:diguanylate cyclase (GGDEF)-like protein